MTSIDRHVLSKREIQEQLKSLPAWQVRQGKLHRELIFADFAEAFGFMTRLAILAEKHDHHPEWKNVYNRVIIDLVTHDTGGISPADFFLAQAAEKFAQPG